MKKCNCKYPIKSINWQSCANCGGETVKCNCGKPAKWKTSRGIVTHYTCDDCETILNRGADEETNQVRIR